MSTLSKSKLMAYRQCSKRLWLETNQPTLVGEAGLDRIKPQVGREVGAIARKLYDEPGLGNIIDAQQDGFAAALSRGRRVCLWSTDLVMGEVAGRVRLPSRHFVHCFDDSFRRLAAWR